MFAYTWLETIAYTITEHIYFWLANQKSSKQGFACTNYKSIPIPLLCITIFSWPTYAVGV